ncbi:MAG: ATP F0F1 synthase subunit B, partial [Hyphomicrobiales bacterium]|nr:ATP F0F1 synthase subunit B [Hyphomicrobiales bacterium]
MPRLFADPEFWVAVAFVTFLGLAAWFGAFKALVNGLDQRGQRIAAELAEAKRLREEAQTLLASYEKRRLEAEGEAAAIIAQAKVDAERLAKEAEEKLADFV